MNQALILGAILIFFVTAFVLLLFYFLAAIQKREREIKKEREEASRRIYELAILKELGERIGYSLNVEEIMSLITGSLHQFINYSVVSYAVITEQKVNLNTHIEVSVNRAFLDDMKRRMLASLEALTDKTPGSYAVEEKISGAILIEELNQAVGSIFNIPLVISGSVVGVLSIANTQKGLYKEADMTILYKIVSQASTAVTRLQEVVTTEEQKLMKVREEFTSMIVHELRSPLDGIKKIVELVVSGHIAPDSPEFKQYLGMIHQSSASMLELVSDILDLSKLQAGKFEVNKEESSIKDLIENRIMFYKVSASTREVALENYLSPDLPAAALFDPQALKQILNNFLSNAIKFTPKGGSILVSAFVVREGSLPALSIDFGKYKIFPTITDLKTKQDSICITVSDTGIGIPASDLDKLFQTYKQAKISPVAKDEKGTGLGLVIAKGIAEAHEGTVGVVSKEGMGSTFFFTLPL